MTPIHVRFSLRWHILFFIAGTLTTFHLNAQPRSGLPSAIAADGLRTIENSQIRVGVNLKAGGAITYLTFLNDYNGKVTAHKNMVSNPDLGRQIQIGLYGGPTNYSDHSGWTNLGWDPIQAGDFFGFPSQVLDFRKEDNLLYVKTIPNQWGIRNEPGEATIEHWIRLDGNVVKVHAKVALFRKDQTHYNARGQEFPCVYLIGDYHNMWYYSDGAPYTNGGLTLSRIQPPETSFYGNVFPTEPWMASTNENGYGVGVFVADNLEWTRGYFGADLSGDENSTVASYLAATNHVELDYNTVYEWDYSLVLGHLDDIRTYVYNQPRLSKGPNFLFDNSRKGWYYETARDSGWPIAGKLHVQLTDGSSSRISSPFVFWKGRDNPKIYLRAAFNTRSDRFRLKWRRSDEKIMYGTSERVKEFPIINDGQFHTYAIDLSAVSGWMDNNIGQIQFETTSDVNGPDVWAEFAWISTSPDGPSPTPDPINPPPIPGPCEPGCTTVSVQKLQYVRANQK